MLDSLTVSATDQGRYAGEDTGGMVRRCLVRLARLVVPPPGEPLLALPAGLGTSLHVSLPDFGPCDPISRHGRDGEAAFAYQQHPPSGRRRDRVRERLDVRRPRVRAAER